MMRLKKGDYYGFNKESYLWLRERGVSHHLMQDIARNPLGVYSFYRARVDQGKSFALVPKEYQEEVLQAILEFANSEDK